MSIIIKNWYANLSVLKREMKDNTFVISCFEVSEPVHNNMVKFELQKYVPNEIIYPQNFILFNTTSYVSQNEKVFLVELDTKLSGKKVTINITRLKENKRNEIIECGILHFYGILYKAY